MIKLTLLTKEKIIVGFKLEGHALYDTKGKDIVCAAVSMLAINTVNAVEIFTEDLFSAESDESNGMLYFRFLGDEISEKGRVLLDALILGMQEVKSQYGEKYLSIISKEE